MYADFLRRCHLSEDKYFVALLQLLRSFSCCYRSCAKIKLEAADFDNLTLYMEPRLALLSHFLCPENDRPNLRSRRLVVVFPAKTNLHVLAIFKQKISISRWQVSNKGFRFPVGSTIQRLRFFFAAIA